MVENDHGRFVAIVTAFAMVASVAFACGGPHEKIVENPVNALPSASASAAPPANDANRPLTLDECVELGEWIKKACEERENQRSTQIDGYCADMARGTTGDARWIEKDCVPNIHYMDAVCIKSTTNIRKIMDCEQSALR